MKIYINAESINDFGIENYFDENISLIGTGKHELFTNLHEFLESFKVDVKRRGKISIEVRNLHQEEERLDGDHVLAHGTGDFIGLFKDGSICFKMETRFTIIYKWTNGKWLVQHLHQSTPDLEQMDGEEFPVTLGKQVKKNQQAVHALGTAYYYISRLNLKTKKIELVKRSREMYLDIKDNSADWNPQFELIEGIIAEPFVQKYIDFFDIQTMAARLHNKESMSSEFKLKEGSWFLSMIVPQSYDKNGNVTSVLIANRDVTDEKLQELKQEEELREAKLKAECANKAKSTFLFNMSHDIRTPMNAIVGLTAIAGANIESQDRVIECLSKITKSSRHLLGLINEVLDMARIESGKMTLAQEDFNLPDLVDNLITLTKPVIDEHKHNLDIHINHIEHESVCGDSLRIQQVFVNLMSNAIKYTPDGGNIIFSIEEKPNGFSELGCYEFTIEDNGIGMSPEFQKIMFDPFSRADDHRTTRVQGTGLGMAITKGLIEQMNGSIEVTSQVGVGSVFVITIPFEIAREQKKDKEIAEKYDIRGLHLLAAEDNELNAEIIEMLLTDDGAKVTVVENGRQAVEHFESNPPGTFDAILMDVMMPVMDGIAATKAIRAMDRADAKTIPIIAMTANAFEEDAKRCLAAGMTAHLAKPFQIEDVEKTIVECCGK